MEGKMTIFKSNGTSTSQEMNQPATYEQVRENLNDAMVEHVYTQFDDIQVYVDEEGLMKGLLENPMASLMAGQRIVGPCVILEGVAKWVE